jgi:hypothetical protein
MMRYANSGIVPPGVDIKNSSVMRQYAEEARWATSCKGNEPMTTQQAPYNQDPDIRLPETVSDLFPSKWLSASDLNSRTFDLTIDRIEPGMFPIHPRTREKELKAVAYFTGAKKGLILNATQCTQIAEIAGSEIFATWPGTRVTLAPGKAPNGKPTITIRTAPTPENKETPNGDTPAHEEKSPAPAEDPPANDPVDLLVDEGHEEKLPAGHDVNPETGEIFDYRYSDGARVELSERSVFDSYRRAHEEEIPASRGALIDWTFNTRVTQIAKDAGLI